MTIEAPSRAPHQRLESFGPSGWVMTDPVDTPRPATADELAQEDQYFELADSRMVIRGLGRTASTLPDGMSPEEFVHTETNPTDDAGAEIHAGSTQRLHEIISEAASCGIDEQTLTTLGQIFRNHSADGQLDSSQRFIQKYHFDIAPSGLRTLVRRYTSERLRKEEKGTLYHFHQTSVERLDSILDSGGLISSDEQRRRGFPIRSSGSNHDVVQMTRDAYDKDGNLVAAGIKATTSHLGSGGSGLTLVFKESIMDNPDYDGTDFHPRIPEAPLSKVAYFLIDDGEMIPAIKQKILERGLSVDVISRKEWLDTYKTQGTLTSY